MYKRQILLKNEEEISLIKEGADILGRVHGEVAQAMKPGITTQQLDALAEVCIKDHGGEPSFKGYKKFPATLCTSVNEYVVHGIPSNRVLQEGDIVYVDCGVHYKGFHSDAAFTYSVGAVSNDVRQLLQVKKEALYYGICINKACLLYTSPSPRD